MLRHFFLVALGLSSAGAAAGDASWRPVYVVGSDGNATCGTRDDLIRLVRAGSPVRIAWGGPLPQGGGLEHAADVQLLTIRDGHVFAQLDPVVVQRPASGGGLDLLTKEDMRFTALISTDGQLSGGVLGRESIRHPVAAAWFVPGNALKETKIRASCRAPARYY